MIAVVTLLLIAVVSLPSTHGFVVPNDLPRQTVAAYPDLSSKRRCRHHPSPHSAGSRRRRKRHGLATGIFSLNNNRIDDNVPTTTMTTTKGPLDAALTWLISDTGSVLLGSAGLIALLVGRLWWDGGDNDNDMAEAMVVTTRETLLAVVAIGAVLLNGLSQLDVPTALAETVVLDGVNAPTARLSVSSSSTTDNTIAWVLESLVQATPAALSAVYLRQSSSSAARWEIVGGVGILPSDLLLTMADQSIEQLQQQRPIIVPAPTPILDRFLVVNNNNDDKKVPGESYLPTLQALPGKVELLSYLPRNTQAVLVLSCGDDNSNNGVVVVGSNRARSFTPRDIAWCRAAVSRISTSSLSSLAT
jgi:hypothetical protein